MAAPPQRRSSLLPPIPAVLWLAIFFLAPLLIITALSFLSRGDYGEIQMPLTFENYKRFFGLSELGFDWLYPLIALRSLILGLATSILCLLVGTPVAFFIGRLSSRLRHIALVLVVVPFWTNLLIRTYAWQILLGPNGWFTAFAQLFGLSEDALYPGTFAVLVGMVCDFLPFFILPVYASVEKIDWTLAEAAADLGANRFQIFRHAILPQISPGLAAGLILVFLPATGQFVIPDLLGGAKTVMLGNVIQQQFGQSRDWQFGSSVSCVTLVLALFSYWTYSTFLRRKGMEDVL